MEPQEMEREQYLSAEDILDMPEGSDLGIHKVEIPEWKKNGKAGILCYRAMTADQALAFNASIKTPALRENAWVRILAEQACDENGKLLFTSKDLAALRKRNAGVFSRLQEKFIAVNGNGRMPKTWEALKAILEEVGVEAYVIEMVGQRWQTTEETAKNS